MAIGSECALRWRPGITPRLRPPPNATESAWARADGAPRARLDAFFAKLLRGESVTVYFLGESVTRGTGATHSCLTCTDRVATANAARAAQRHDWINQSLVDGGTAGAQYAAVRSRAAPPAAAAAAAAAGARCPTVELPAADPYQSCTGGAPRGEAPPTTFFSQSSAAGAQLACASRSRTCFPRNSWRCLLIHWLQHAFPGQATMRTSAKPLLFMAACFGASLGGVDLVVHEYAVNGGGRMLCLQERVLRAALAGPERPAVLMLLWVPKHFKPAPPHSTLTDVQANLAALGAHYDLPTLHMQRAFSAPCERHLPGVDPTGASWCYARDGARHGEEGMLHGDMYHPNVDGHAFFAAHILELLERSARAARETASLLSLIHI